MQNAVNAVDQILLGTVRTRHAHLCGSLLLRHLLAVDEVYSSDRYMSDLLAELLRWRMAAGGHALLLSATLGASLRLQLIGIAPVDVEAAEAAPYPVMSWVEHGRECMAKILSEGPEKAVTLDPQPIQPAAGAVARLAAGAALIVRNHAGCRGSPSAGADEVIRFALGAARLRDDRHGLERDQS